MANILSLGTENTADISALKEIIGEPQSGESPPTGLQRAIEDLQNEQSALEHRLESAEDTAMNANTAAQAAKTVAEEALPKKGGEMEGVITANYNLTAVTDGMALPGTKMQLLAAPQDKSLNILYLSAASDHIFNSCLGFGNDAFRHGVSSNKLTIIRGVKEPVYEDDAVNKAYLDSRFVIGSFRGTGKTAQTINLGFRPKFIAVMNSWYSVEHTNIHYYGFAIDGCPLKYDIDYTGSVLEIVDNGFTVMNMTQEGRFANSSTDGFVYYKDGLLLNSTDGTMFYFAIR